MFVNRDLISEVCWESSRSLYDQISANPLHILLFLQILREDALSGYGIQNQILKTDFCDVITLEFYNTESFIGNLELVA